MIKLFCIPYSGGSANVYYKWKDMINRELQLCPVETSGRGKRILEPLYNTLEEAADDIANKIRQELKHNDKYMIFGHSLGALLAFETYYKLIEKECQEPEHIFFSSRKAPQKENKKISYSNLPDEDFLKIVFAYGGNTEEVFENEDLLKLFLPVLRSDFKIAEHYEYKQKKTKINCNISVLNGKNDKSIREADMCEWKSFTSENCKIVFLEGEHFFITENVVGVTDYINKIAENVKMTQMHSQ